MRLRMTPKIGGRIALRQRLAAVDHRAARFACRPTSVLPSVDLPEPLSPTSPTTSRSAIASDTSSTRVYDLPRPIAKLLRQLAASSSAVMTTMYRVRYECDVQAIDVRARLRGAASSGGVTVVHRRTAAVVRFAEPHGVRAAGEVAASAGGAKRSGGLPSIGCSRCASLSTCWTASHRVDRACTDAPIGRRCRRRCRARRSRPAYMTVTWSAIRATTPRSCVIRMIAMPFSRCSSCIRSRICAWIVTSSAVVGSSAISIAGSHAMAMAIIDRCSMPPENSNGYCVARFAASGMRVAASSSMARSAACLLRVAAVDDAASR